MILFTLTECLLFSFPYWKFKMLLISSSFVHNNHDYLILSRTLWADCLLGVQHNILLFNDCCLKKSFNELRNKTYLHVLCTLKIEQTMCLSVRGTIIVPKRIGRVNVFRIDLFYSLNTLSEVPSAKIPDSIP